MRYYAPFKADGVNLNTLRTNPALAGNTEPLVWGLREVLDYAEVLLNRDDMDAKADAFIDFLAERVVGREFHRRDPGPSTDQVRSFADLEEFFRAIFNFLEVQGPGRRDLADPPHRHDPEGPQPAGQHQHPVQGAGHRRRSRERPALGRIRRTAASTWSTWRALDPLAQDLVFARVVSKLREHLERRDLGVDHVVVFVDELNKYAPPDGPDTYVRKMLLDLSERGRYLGLVLFSAQQFRSQVHRRVVGNAGTAVFGRMDMDELATPGYGMLSPATKAKLAALPKGELMVRHPHFTQPMFVRFPRPAVLAGRDGVERFPPEPDLPFEDAVVRRLRALDPSLPTNRLRDLIAGRPPDDVVRALHATIRTRPDDVLAFFMKCLGREVAPRTVAPRAGVPPLRLSDDPYG